MYVNVDSSALDGKQEPKTSSMWAVSLLPSVGDYLVGQMERECNESWIGTALHLDREPQWPAVKTISTLSRWSTVEQHW